MLRRGAEWMLSRQNRDGGWGETCFSYEDESFAGLGTSTPSQTAWAVLALQSASLGAHPVAPRYADEPEKLRTSHPWTYDWNAGPLFDRLTYRELADGLLRELTRMGVTKPMRFIPGENAGPGGPAT